MSNTRKLNEEPIADPRADSGGEYTPSRDRHRRDARRSRGLGVLLAEVRDVRCWGIVSGCWGGQWVTTSDFAKRYRKRMHVPNAAANDGNISVCLKDRCEQVYERRQQTSKGPDQRRNRESTWLTAVTALDTPETFPAAAYGLGLCVPEKSQLLSARYDELYVFKS